MLGVDSPGRRLEQALHARGERLALAWVESNPPAPCPGCGRTLETVLPRTSGAGRTRIWCSNACRQRAYRARKSGPQAVVTIAAEVTGSPAPVEHTLDQCIVAVLESPQAVSAVLDVVRRAMNDGALEQHQYADVQIALVALRETMNPDQ